MISMITGEHRCSIRCVRVIKSPELAIIVQVISRHHEKNSAAGGRAKDLQQNSRAPKISRLISNTTQVHAQHTEAQMAGR